MKPLPLMAEDLVNELDAQYPERSPSKAESHIDMIYRGAQRDLVRGLMNRLQRSQENILESHVHK